MVTLYASSNFWTELSSELYIHTHTLNKLPHNLWHEPNGCYLMAICCEMKTHQKCQINYTGITCRSITDCIRRICSIQRKENNIDNKKWQQFAIHKNTLYCSWWYAMRVGGRILSWHIHTSHVLCHIISRRKIYTLFINMQWDSRKEVGTKFLLRKIRPL